MGLWAVLLLLVQDGGAYVPPTKVTVAVGETTTATLNFSPVVMGCDNGDLVRLERSYNVIRLTGQQEGQTNCVFRMSYAAPGHVIAVTVTPPRKRSK
jgi:hypothetical protein